MIPGAAAAAGHHLAGAPPAAPLELRGVAHRFGRRWVLRGLDLRVEPAEVVAVVGDNGAGKSTLLRIAATLLKPLRGRGWIRGLELDADADRVRGRIGLLGDSPALYEDLTPAENLRFAMAMRGLGGDRQRIASILERVRLDDHADVRVRRFSQGMRRRVAIGRILLSPPDLLLMDEPYASLDREGVALVNDLILDVVQGGGGVLLATHDLYSGAEVTDRVLTLDRGLFAPLAGSTGPSGSTIRQGEGSGAGG